MKQAIWHTDLTHDPWEVLNFCCVGIKVKWRSGLGLQTLVTWHFDGLCPPFAFSCLSFGVGQLAHSVLIRVFLAQSSSLLWLKRADESCETEPK